MPTENPRTANIVIIGDNEVSLFQDLLESLRNHAGTHVVAEFPSLSKALGAGIGQKLPADVVIVLQSYPDEFAQEEINVLIGRLIFARIICCYGPWCAADGRSHELWPIAFRIPVVSAPAFIEQELQGFQENRQPLSPMSAGEEVFAHRSYFPIVPDEESSHRVIVLSDDVQLRSTVKQVLNLLGCVCNPLPMQVASIENYLRSNRESIDLAMIDLDGPRQYVDSCIESLRSEFEIANIAGLSVFAASLQCNPDSRPAELDIQYVSHFVDKTELLSQLQ